MQTLTFSKQLATQRPTNAAFRPPVAHVYAAEFTTEAVNILQAKVTTPTTQATLSVFARLDATLEWTLLKTYTPCPQSLLVKLDLPAGLLIRLESSLPAITASVINDATDKDLEQDASLEDVIGKVNALNEKVKELAENPSINFASPSDIHSLFAPSLTLTPSTLRFTAQYTPSYITTDFALPNGTPENFHEGDYIKIRYDGNQELTYTYAGEPGAYMMFVGPQGGDHAHIHFYDDICTDNFQFYATLEGKGNQDTFQVIELRILGQLYTVSGQTEDPANPKVVTTANLTEFKNLMGEDMIVLASDEEFNEMLNAIVENEEAPGETTPKAFSDTWHFSNDTSSSQLSLIVVDFSDNTPFVEGLSTVVVNDTFSFIKSNADQFYASNQICLINYQPSTKTISLLLMSGQEFTFESITLNGTKYICETA